jgi:hypothetical protein
MTADFWLGVYVGFIVAALLSVLIVGLVFPSWDDYRRKRDA